MPSDLTPDDPDLWFELGEYIYHVGLGVGAGSLDQALQAFDKAVELDPGFGPFRVHSLALTIAGGDRADAERRLAEYRDATEFARTVERSRTVDMSTLARIRSNYNQPPGPPRPAQGDALGEPGPRRCG